MYSSTNSKLISSTSKYRDNVKIKFPSVESYQNWIATIKKERNQKRCKVRISIYIFYCYYLVNFSIIFIIVVNLFLYLLCSCVIQE